MAPKPSGAYSQAIIANGFVFVAGQGPFDPQSRELVGVDAPSQVQQAMKNLEGVLAAAGCGLKDLVSLRVYIKDLRLKPEVDALLAELLPRPFPARVTVPIPFDSFLIEVDGIAVLPPTKGLAG